MQNNRTTNILIIEDELPYQIRLKKAFEKYFAEKNILYSIKLATTEDKAIHYLTNHNFDICIFDLNLNGKIAGLDLLKKYSKTSVAYPVICSSYHDDKEIIRKGYRNGCLDFIRKPITEKTVPLLMQSFESFNADSHVEDFIFSNFITQDDDLKERIREIKALARDKISTHIGGPTGTGKQILTKIIHELYSGASTPFIECNCATLGTLTESILFGHKKGSFTGATQNKDGLFKLANGGVIFLDEIDKIPLDIQDKLLKVIEQKQFRPVGSEKHLQTDCLIVSASSQNLGQLISDGKFRLDLKERLCALHIELTPLAERRKDIAFQLDYFMERHPTGRVFSVSKDALHFLTNHYPWSGNTRELCQLINKWQRIQIKEVTFEHVEVLIQKTISQTYKILNKNIIHLIDRIGLPEFEEALYCEIMDYYRKRYNGKVRKTIGSIKTNREKYYKYSKIKLGEMHEQIQQ